MNGEGMNLDAYVAETLRAIANGVRQAQSDPELGAYIGRSPAGSRSNGGVATDRNDNAITMVRFDIATTVTDKVAGGIEGGVTVVSLFNFGGKENTEASSSAVSRVAFEVPMAFPVPQQQRADDAAGLARRSDWNPGTIND